MKIVKAERDEYTLDRRFTVLVESFEMLGIRVAVERYLIDEIVRLLSQEMSKEIMAKVDKEELVRELTRKSIEDISARLSQSLKIEGVKDGKEETDDKKSD